jgi:peptidoglycan/xylan/chitin deacetylase (PgdA/CDA1 family)
MGPHGLMFHHFHGNRHEPSQGSVSADDFRRILNHYGAERFLSPEEWVHRARTQTLREQDLCITFDDNLRCQYDVALPVLDEYGLKAFWFVYTSPLDGKIERLELYRYFRHQFFASMDGFYEAFFASVAERVSEAALTSGERKFQASNFLKEYAFYSENDRRFRYFRDEIMGPELYYDVMDSMVADAFQRSGRNEAWILSHLWMDGPSLKALHEQQHAVGLHSHTHPTMMEKLPAEQQHQEFKINYDILSGLLGSRPTTMSHPSNSYDATTLRILTQMNIVTGFRADVGQTRHGALEHPRQDHSHVMRELFAIDPGRN